MRRILLISAYDAGSHRAWREGLVETLAHCEVTTLTLPARHFAWRSRSNSMTLAFEYRDILTAEYDLLIATSMTDLSALRGLVPELARLPTLLYWHENQFDYPKGHHRDDRNRLSMQITNLYSGLAADVLIFNSQWNQQSFLEGAGQLLDGMPDGVPEGLIERLRARSMVIPVGLDLGGFACGTAQESLRPMQREGPIRLLWNHRWEFDKGPERLMALLVALETRRIDFRLHLRGQQFRREPPIFRTLIDRYQSRIEQAGYLPDRQSYLEAIARCDVVLSTALHEFQGLSILEAAACGVWPLVPDRLSYPEYFDGAHRYRSVLDDPEAEAQAAADLLARWLQSSRPRFDARSLAHLSWPAIGAQWRALLERLSSIS